MTAAERVEHFEREHGQKFRRLALCWADTAEDGEDAYQDSLLQFWRHSGAIRDGAASAWFWTTLRRAVANQWRRRNRKPTAELSLALLDETPGGGDLEQLVEQRELIDQVLKLRPSRAPVVFARGLGMQHDEIAAALSLTRRQVQRRLYRGQAELTGSGPRP